MPVQPNIATLRRIRTWLALLAVALQLAVGTVHYHAALGHADAEHRGAAAAAGPVAGSVDASAPALPSVPDTSDDCRVCLGLALAAMAILPIAVIVAVAALQGHAPQSIFVKIAARRVGAFRPRAPPLPNCA